MRWLLALCFVTVSLGGCIDGLFGGDLTEGDLVRLVRFTFDDETIIELEDVEDPDDFFQAMTETFFTYTHTGADVAVADVEAVFVDSRGRDVVRPLSDYTSAAILAEGDQVTITGAIAYSPMVLRDDTGVLAAREHVIAEWFEVDGAPLPFAMDRGASATWEFDAASEAAIGFSELFHEMNETEYDVECDETCRTVERDQYGAVEISDMGLSFGGDAHGTMSLAAVPSGSDTHLDLALDGTLSASVMAEMLVRVFDAPDNETDESGAYGADLTGSMTGEGLMRLVFGPEGLKATGGEGSFSTSATGTVWTPDEPRDSAEPFFEGEEMPSESFPYEETPYESGDEVPGLVADLMADIYGMTLIPGDAFEFVVSIDEEIAMQGTFEVRVAAAEEITVQAGTFDALRIETSLDFEATTGGSPNAMGFEGMTHWIDAESYLPLRMEQSTPEGWPDDEDLEEWMDQLGDFDIDTPDDLTVDLSARGSVELTQLEGEIRFPGVMSLMGMWGGASLASSALMFAAVSDLGGAAFSDAPAYEYEEAPSVAFSRDDDELRAVMASADADWWDIVVDVGGDCSVTLVTDRGEQPVGYRASVEPQPVKAGDTLRVYESPCTMTLVHEPTNTLMGTWSF